MLKVQCPNCEAQLSAPEEFVGKNVRCQQCKTKFTVQAPQAAPPASAKPVSTPAGKTAPAPPVKNHDEQPIPAFGEESFAAAPVAPPAIMTDSLAMGESRSWGDLFEFRFKSFLTLRIVRWVYIGGIVASVIYLAVATIFFVLSSIRTFSANQQLIQPVAQSRLADNLVATTSIQGLQDFDNPLIQIKPGIFDQFSQPTPTSKSIDFLVALLLYLATCVGVLYGLLFLRLFCETVLIHYHKAGTLKRIEAKL